MRFSAIHPSPEHHHRRRSCELDIRFRNARALSRDDDDADHPFTPSPDLSPPDRPNRHETDLTDAPD